MNEEVKVVSFTVEELDKMLAFLGEVPARYSLDLITFIRAKAQEQLGAQEQVPEATQE